MSWKKKKILKIRDSLVLPGQSLVPSWPAQTSQTSKNSDWQAIRIHHMDIFSYSVQNLRQTPLRLIPKQTDAEAKISLHLCVEVHAPLDKPHLDFMLSVSWQFAAFSWPGAPTRPPPQLMGCWNMNYSFGFKMNQNRFLRRHMNTHMITARLRLDRCRVI